MANESGTDDPFQNPYISAADVANDPASGNGLSISSQVRVGQIITFALIQGVVVIAGIMLWLVWDAKGNAQPADQDDLLLYIGIGVAAAGLIGSFVVSSIMRRSAIEKFRQFATAEDAQRSVDSTSSTAVSQLLVVAQTGTLIGQALLEGPAVINAIFMMMNENLIHIGVIAVLIIGIAIQVPTVGKRRAMIEEGLNM